MTFAGSPDRVESRLVPEAGFELDTFPISGLPRRPAAAQLRAACARVGRPGRTASAILARRRPDVVLGAGGYVAGPMVLAARLRGIPAALTEADAHLGLANRLAAPFARRRLPRVRDRRSRRSEGARSSAGRSRSPIAARAARRGVAASGSPQTARSSRSSAGSPARRSLNEIAVEAWGSDGPEVLHISGERDFDALRPRVARPDYVLLPHDRPVRRGARGRRSRRLARRRDRVGARRRRDAVDPRPVPVRDGRPPDAQRASLRARAEAQSSSPDAEVGRMPAGRRGAAREPRAARGDARGDAGARATRRGGRRSPTSSSRSPVEAGELC